MFSRYIAVSIALSALSVACDEAAGPTEGDAVHAPAPADTCDEPQRRCPYLFRYADQENVTVEVRGDFRAGGWDSGLALTRSNRTWTAAVEIPYDTPVQYKLVVDGEWIIDPGNPDTVFDGGNQNSLLYPATCLNYVCGTP